MAIVTSRLRHDDPAASLPPGETVRGVRVVRVATSRFGRGSLVGRLVDYLTFYVAAAWALARIARAGDVIVAKTDPPLVALAAAPVAWARRAMLVCWMQDIYPEVAARLGVRFVAGPVERILAWARDRVLRSAARVVVLGGTMARVVRARGVAAERIVVLHNWLAAPGDAPAGANPLRHAWDLEGRFVVGYSGNLGRAHEGDTMLGAARLLADDRGIVFVMTGDGHVMRQLKARVAAERLGNVRFHPFQPAETLAVSLALPDVHWVSLLPALEGLIVPSKTYGILAAGRPLIAVAARDGEIGRLVADEGCGLQVDPGDAAGLVAAIRTLRDDPARGAAMGARGRRLVQGVLSRDAALAGWRALLDELTHRGTMP